MGYYGTSIMPQTIGTGVLGIQREFKHFRSKQKVDPHASQFTQPLSVPPGCGHDE